MANSANFNQTPPKPKSPLQRPSLVGNARKHSANPSPAGSRFNPSLNYTLEAVKSVYIPSTPPSQATRAHLPLLNLEVLPDAENEFQTSEIRLLLYRLDVANVPYACTPQRVEDHCRAEHDIFGHGIGQALNTVSPLFEAFLSFPNESSAKQEEAVLFGGTRIDLRDDSSEILDGEILGLSDLAHDETAELKTEEHVKSKQTVMESAELKLNEKITIQQMTGDSKDTRTQAIGEEETLVPNGEENIHTLKAVSVSGDPSNEAHRQKRRRGVKRDRGEAGINTCYWLRDQKQASKSKSPGQTAYWLCPSVLMEFSPWKRPYVCLTNALDSEEEKEAFAYKLAD